MASPTPPEMPLSNISPGTIRLDSPARIALAVRLLQTKPQSLSISDYFALLRSHTVSGGRTLDVTSERRHIEACEFWRKRSEAGAKKVLELQARVNELTGKFTTSTKTNRVNHQLQTNPKSPKIDCQPHEEVPVKKKGRITNKKGGPGKTAKRIGNQNESNKRQGQQQETLGSRGLGNSDAIFTSFSGSTISDLISSLRLLQFAKEPYLVPKSITQISQALCIVIQDFINGKHSKAITPARFTREAAAAQIKKSKEIASFSEAVEKSCIKVFSTLGYLADSIQEGDKAIGVRNNEFLVDGVGGAIKMLIGVLSLIHKNTRALLSAALYPQLSPGKLVVMDIRLELTMVLVRLLKGLNSEVEYQRNIIEGVFHCFLQVIGGFLSYSFISTPNQGSEDVLPMEKLAVEETSWYLLRIFESVLESTDCPLGAGERGLGNKSKEKLKYALVKSLFDTKMESKGGVEGEWRRKRENEGGFWEGLEADRLAKDFLIIESPFSRVLWELLGLDVLGA